MMRSISNKNRNSHTMGIKHCCYIFYFTLALVSLVQAVNPNIPDVFNATRRGLQACEAVNIIDKCWRCKADWADNRQAITNCVQGFAKGTTGGKGGDIYTVTSEADDDAANPKEGTLRFGVVQLRPLWIIFERDMVISLTQELVVNSHTTIDGRGAKVELISGGITLMNVENVIIHNIEIHDVKPLPGGQIKSSDAPAIVRQRSDGDAINVVGSKQVWIDHCSLSKAFDGLADVTLASTHVTISNCKFFQQSKAVLFGADDNHQQDKVMLGTVAFNWFTDNVDQRMPRCRFGFFQIVNNNYDRWITYAIGGSAAPTILSQGNRFLAPDDHTKKHVIARTGTGDAESMKWPWRTEKDVLENGAVFIPSGQDPTLTPEQQAGMIPAEPGESAIKLTSSAGVLPCKPGAPC